MLRAIIITVVLAIMIPVCNVAAQIPTVERDALIALYTATNGAGWTDNTGWDTATLGTECTWYGVTCASGHVQSLNLNSNQLIGSIPPELGNLPNLQELSVGYNQLSGSIPPELGNLSNSQDLFVGYNQLSGNIPPELGNLSSLGSLILESNQLDGSIPPELGNLSNLHTLYLGFNQLSGSIPPELGNLASLQLMHLENNQLSGSIPPELGNLSSVTSLFLHENQLIGSIPPELGNLSSSTQLILAYNQLSGSIPPELGNLSSLRYLALSYNQLSGTIPADLGNLSSLRELHLQHNQLGGTIPPELGNLSSLTQLILGSYLDTNNLSGSIPPELGNLSSLTQLILENNQLSGSIPPELGGLSNLQELSLYSNNLSGNIPPELGNLSSLNDGYLDLRWNALHSTDAALIAFLNGKQSGGDWQSTQTIAPENLIVDWLGDHTMGLSWDAVSYLSDPGGYEAFFIPTAGGSWISAGQTSAKTELEIPVTGLDAGVSYDLAVASYTSPHAYNQNLVMSDLSDVSMATTSTTGCAAPAIHVAWGNPTTLSVMGTFDSYSWSTGETSATIDVSPSEKRFYWVTTTSTGPCQESAIILIDQEIFADGFEHADTSSWSSVAGG